MFYEGSSCCNSICEHRNVCRLLSDLDTAPDACREPPATLALSIACKGHCRTLRPCPRVTAGRPRSLLCSFSLRPGPSLGRLAGPVAEHPPSARHPSSAALQFQFYGAFPSCSTVCHCPVSLSCLTQVGADSLLGDQMRLVSRAQRKEHVLRWRVKQWKAATGLRQILHSGSLRMEPRSPGTRCTGDLQPRAHPERRFTPSLGPSRTKGYETYRPTGEQRT